METHLKGKKLRLTKITDEVFGGQHPNGIYVGYEAEGWCSYGIKKGMRCTLFRYNTVAEKLGQSYTLSTSIVDSFDEETMILRTQNSKYTVEICA